MKKILSFAILCLSISIVIGSVIIAKSISNNGDNVSNGLSSISSGLISVGSNIGNMNNNNTAAFRNTFDLTAEATYLGISNVKLVELATSESSGIPYIKIGNEYVFSKNALDKWLETARFELKD